MVVSHDQRACALDDSTGSVVGVEETPIPQELDMGWNPSECLEVPRSGSLEVSIDCGEEGIPSGIPLQVRNTILRTKELCWSLLEWSPQNHQPISMFYFALGVSTVQGLYPN
jgi:hypothetical protein